MKKSFVFSLIVLVFVISWSCVNDSTKAADGDKSQAENKKVVPAATTQPAQTKVVDPKTTSAQASTSVKTTAAKTATSTQKAKQQAKKTTSKAQSAAPKQAQTTAVSGEIEIGNEIGNDLGDFQSYDPDSVLRSMSDSRGKLTIMIMWNSLCGHCVTENKKIAEYYPEYKDKEYINGDGLDVYAIALDKERATWIDHLEKANYPWTNNVYVLDSWKDPDVRFFGIKNLPGIFLIDGNGIVLEKGFTGKEMPEVLSKYLKK